MNHSSFIANGGNFTLLDKANVRPERLFFRLPLDRINWITSSFLIGTLALTLTAVPLYLWFFGLDWFQVVLFFAVLAACGFSVTLGYHRLFSHITFQASWPIRLFTLIFGAAAFENSVLMWASEHRRHHKHVDHDDDPYCISKGFFYAHIGWLLFKLKTDQPYDNVADLQKDKLVCWQDRHVQWIAVLVSFGIPAILGFLWNGWRGALGAFLIAGVARIVVLQHCTFLINSACHTIGRQPYSTRCSARDSFLLALFTMGEGYHNYHHEFQHDYRNGVKPWQFDPTKWLIWTLSKLRLVRNLRRVPADKIESASTNQKRELLMCGPSLIVRLTIAAFVFLILGVTSVIHAERPDSTAGTSNAGTRKLFIDPSSTSVALRGKASLIVSPLAHRDGNYVGDYQLKVRPYFFKSEKGSLLLAASDDAVRKLQTGTAINFTGKAVTHKDGRTHIVLGRATPSSGNRGGVTFSIITDDAKIVFNTSYHFGT